MDISLLASAGIAVPGLILAAVFLPTRAGHDNRPTPIQTEADVVST
jgi:hypothetical protein